MSAGMSPAGDVDQSSVVVIGAGVSGLRAAQLLQQQGCSVTVLEAQYVPTSQLAGMWAQPLLTSLTL